MTRYLIAQLERDIENLKNLRKIGLYSKHDVYILTKYANRIIEIVRNGVDMDSNKIAQALNYSITGENFVYADPNEYIYASLSQPPIKIIDKNDSDDELDYTVECPNCHKYVNYGTQIYMISGHLYCNNKGCREKLIEENEFLKEKYG